MLAEKPKYRLTAKAFIAPNLLKEGTVIYFSGEPGPHFEPLNAAAAERFEQYAKDHPEAMLGRPVDNLPMRVDEVEIVSVPSDKQTARALTIDELAEGKGAKPVRTMADVRELMNPEPVETIPPDEEYGARSVAELSAADRVALAEAEAGAKLAAEAKAKAQEAKQAKGDKPE